MCTLVFDISIINNESEYQQQQFLNAFGKTITAVKDLQILLDLYLIAYDTKRDI